MSLLEIPLPGATNSNQRDPDMLVDIRSVVIGPNGALQYSDIVFPTATTAAGTLTLSPSTKSVAAGVTTDNFTLGAMQAITSSVLVTLSDGGAGGNFTPATITLQASAQTAVFTYKPPSNHGVGVVTLTASTSSLGTASASVSITSTALSSSPTAATGSLTNWKPQTQFSHATAAAQAALNKTGTFRIIFVGDSLTAGIGAVSPYRLSSPPSFTSNALASVSPTLSGINQIVAGGDLMADNRVTFTGATKFSGAQTFGGNVIQMPTSSDTCILTFGVPFDHVRVVYVDLAHAFDIAIDGKPTGSPAPAGSNTSSMLSHVWTVVRGSHTITLLPAIADVFVQSVEVWDSTVGGQVQIINGGQGGLSSTSLIQSATFSDYTSGMLAEAANLAIINLGTNDLNNGTPTLAEYKSNIDNGVALLQAQNCDVILVFPASVVSDGYAQNGDAYLTALKAISATRNVPLLDLRMLYGPITSMPAAWIHDNLHKTEIFYNLQGILYAKIIATGVGQASSAAASDVASYLG